MTRSVPVGSVRRFGDRALLIGVEDPVAGRTLVASFERALLGFDVELVCGLATVCVLARDPDAALAPLTAAVRAVLGAPPALVRDDDGDGAAGGGRLVTIPCAFDGPDLDEVAGLAGLSRDEVVAQLTGGPLTVSVVGFSPGFAYLDGLPPALADIPRRDRPRPTVPAGSVALANGHAAVYPTASPGGWRLVGRTGLPLFSLDEPPYAVLAPGDRVQLRVAATGEEPEPPRQMPPSWSPSPGARPVFEVAAPGLRAVLQDGGRRGVAASGVPTAGAADPVSCALANGLAGNEPGAAVLEVTGGGTRLRVLSRCHAAVVGAAPALRVDGTDVSSSGRLLPLEDGQVLEIGALTRGCRTYVAVAGGFLGPVLFGSRSSDELCGLGAGPLRSAAVLYAGEWAPPLGDHLADGAASALPANGAVALRVVPGPHAGPFDPNVLERVAATTFRAANDSNRVGVRLRAGAPVDWGTGSGELDSQPMVTGAVQLPPGGEPIVLGPDHATLGGYRVPAVVIAADHGLLGQCGPGTEVRLVPVGFEEAGAALRAQRRRLAAAVVGHYPLAAG
jgi:KipI family sensor histidine kinase inhibitor